MRYFEPPVLIPSSLLCIHCDEPVYSVFYDDLDAKKERPFCCQGCLTVYQVLQKEGLEEYYDIKHNAGLYKRRSPVEVQNAKYHYMDDKDFLQEFSYHNSMEFYLEGIHCLACLWLIEKLPKFVPGVISSKLDMEKSIATIVIDESGKFSVVAQTLNQLGYRPHALKKNEEAHDLKIKEQRQYLLRMGIAAAGASNIMLYAVSLYAGAADLYAKIFNALTVVFALPVLTYSAFPFYKNAWHSLKNKTLSIDVPISVSLILGAAMGLYNLFTGVHENYFDSLTTLVFLLLISRYFLKILQEKALSAKDLHFFYQGESVKRLAKDTTDVFEEIHPKYIAIGDQLKIAPGEFIPADGIIIKGKTYINMSLLSGESMPVSLQKADTVFAGTQNISNEIVISVQKNHQETRLGQILKSVESGWSNRAAIVDLTDKVSKYFILGVFALSLVLFLQYALNGQMKVAIEQALTLLIVTCPCALALSVPLTFTRALNKAADNGIIIKNEAVIQKLSEIKNVLIDKTGTLTLGKMNVEKIDRLNHPQSQLELVDIIYSLEKLSLHPVAQALVQYSLQENARLYAVENYVEVPGVGVQGQIIGFDYEINHAGLWENKRLIATFTLSDKVRRDSKIALKKLLRLKLKIFILSGDKASQVEKVAEDLGVNRENVLAELSPEQKSAIVKNTPKSMMIGDGANDAIAFANAHVGVAVLGSVDMALRAADIYLVTPGIAPIHKLLTLGIETMKVIHRNLFLSLAYNMTSVFFVFMGYINPLVAAIIMPLSSVTVLGSSLWGTKKLRNLWK